MDSGEINHAIDINELQKKLDSASGADSLYEDIVNAPFSFKVETAFLFLGIIVLLRVNKTTGNIDRIALSRTEPAAGTVEISVKKFENIKIPLSDPKNIIALAIRTGEPQKTSDWEYLFTPALTGEQARLNQAGGAINYSCVYPLLSGNKGALIFSYYQFDGGKSSDEQTKFMVSYSKLVDDQLGRFD